MKRTISIILLVLITVGLLLPGVMATNNKIVVTYGETTYNNQDYKNIVDNYFSSSSNINEASVKVITADEVNKISTSISQKTYSSSQIFSSALVDLRSADDLDVDVDTSKITTINKDMYESALETAGITKGHVVVTSPISSTGESALAGVMGCYEQATGVEVPEDVKKAANKEIMTEQEVVENSNATPDEIAEVVDEVKEEVKDKGVKDTSEIVPIVNNIVINNNIQISQEDVQKIAETVSDIENAQESVDEYQEQLSDSIEQGESITDDVLDFFGI